MSYQEYQRANLFFDSKDYSGAAEILAPIVAEDPANRAAVELLGRAYFHSAQLGRAEAAFRRLVELDPANGWAYEALGRTLHRQGRPEEAAAFRRLAEAMGTDQDASAVYEVRAANLAD